MEKLQTQATNPGKIKLLRLQVKSVYHIRRGHPSKKRLGDALERLSPGDSQQQKPLEVH